MRSFTKRSIAAALAAATIATSIPLMPASAATQTPAAVTAKSNAVSSDFSARRYYRHYRHGGGAAAFGAFAAFAGTIGAIAAAQDRRDYYNNGYGYYGYGRPYPYYYGRHYYRRW